ncbi:High mobility group box domain-containing protein [Strongyloides ratti]|uniref:Sex-determining region Y protein n=1 Tax=Strongyloides ratti TaxID=34506 RepID=A0A090N004_STRRB|nr:High mobility group box domain-containing protein [Strongyloides ratti]CEF69840.1 High mobility group box domain-containing protein [Strongyloides ratti]
MIFKISTFGLFYFTYFTDLSIVKYIYIFNSKMEQKNDNNNLSFIQFPKNHPQGCRCDDCKKVRREIDKRRIRRPMNAFMLWSKKQRSTTAAMNPGILNSELSRILGIQWKELPEDEKQKYIIEAEHIREEHYKKYPDFKYTKDSSKTRKTQFKLINWQHQTLNYSQQPYNEVITPFFHNMNQRLIDMYITKDELIYLKVNAEQEFAFMFPTETLRQEFSW